MLRTDSVFAACFGRLGEALKKERCALHAYALMTSLHYYLNRTHR